jgi:hypothetical protein
MSIERIPRWKFMIARRADYFRNRARWERDGKPENVILIEPDEDVICDLCNAEITEDTVALRLSGTRITHALCENCVLRFDAERANERRENA